MDNPAPADPENISEAAYLVLKDSSDEKFEYRDGVLYAMSGGTVRHNAIAQSIGGHLMFQLQSAGRRCTVSNSDQQVYIAAYNAYRYPDVTVFCGQPAYLEGRIDIITNPIILVEVLSPSSFVRDYNDKLNEYIEIETLQAYLVVAQETYQVGIYTVTSDSRQWLYQSVRGPESKIVIPSLDITLKLADIYANAEWDST